jgi:hypothetical protein
MTVSIGCGTFRQAMSLRTVVRDAAAVSTTATELEGAGPAPVRLGRAPRTTAHPGTTGREASPRGLDSLDSLEAPVEYSLVQVSDVAGERRFEMLETIHEFAREQPLALGEAAERRRRHARVREQGEGG